ncbi:MAG: hypothetical protein AABZ34_17100 [Nitrospirota bacterium]
MNKRSAITPPRNTPASTTDISKADAIDLSRCPTANSQDCRIFLHHQA